MMSGKLRVLISAILLTPAAAIGLGLGEIRLNSSLNEPLAAEIDLVAATPEELGTLNAQLASQEVFARYGLDRPAYLNSLEFSVGRGQDGRSVLLVRSRDAISEPFVSFLIDVNWPRGRLLREYTVLLDPPAMLAS
jgi:pilus assembly protein FimV